MYSYNEETQKEKHSSNPDLTYVLDQPEIIISRASPRAAHISQRKFIKTHKSLDTDTETTFYCNHNHTHTKIDRKLSEDLLAHRKNNFEKVNSQENIRHWMMNRQASVSSLCSIETSYTSDLSDYDNEDFPLGDETPTKKESMWVKVRKIVRWQPFMQNYKKEYPWIQLAGHSGGFKSGENGTILKKSVRKEVEALNKLMVDPLKLYVPEFKCEVSEEGELYIQMQDLLQDFEHPSFVMDCKMGIRTYLEDEVDKVGKPRKDLYEKMISVDPSEPTDYENETCSCTKSRYMQWREQLSSTASLGFRIEGIKRGEHPPDKDFKKIQSEEDVAKIFGRFIENRTDLQEKYIERLKAIKNVLFTSSFFKTHEIIGSSLLFVHDSKGKVGIWLIDFGKTTPLTNGHSINHQSEWTLGNHEDGYLIGLNNMINVWSNIQSNITTDKT